MTTGTSQPATTAAPPPQPTPIPKAVLCPYCGHLSLNTHRCENCRGYFDPLSRQASQNSMGPWFIRDESNPFRPGCSYETLCTLLRRGKITHDTVIRGPTTRQFWTTARNVPGLAHLLGECHNCHSPASADDLACRVCGADFRCESDRQYLGLAPVHLLPGHTSPEIIAAASLRTPLTPNAAAPIPQATGALSPDLLTPALERVTHPSRRRTDGASLWIGVIAGAAILTTLLALVVRGGAPRANPAPDPEPASSTVPAPASTSTPAPTPLPEQSPPDSIAPAGNPTEPVPIPDAKLPHADVSPQSDIAALLAEPDGSGLPEAQRLLEAPTWPDQSPEQAAFRRVLEARRAQLQFSTAL